jgi:hypothetical protein
MESSEWSADDILNGADRTRSILPVSKRQYAVDGSGMVVTITRWPDGVCVYRLSWGSEILAEGSRKW